MNKSGLTGPHQISPPSPRFNAEEGYTLFVRIALKEKGIPAALLALSVSLSASN